LWKKEESISGYGFEVAGVATNIVLGAVVDKTYPSFINSMGYFCKKIHQYQ
jgi:hypothetical protein